MKILITGATGLLGSHLCKYALEHDYELFALVRKISNKSYLGELDTHANLTIIEGSLDNFPLRESMCFDIVIHTAALVTSDSSQKKIIWETNLEGTKLLYNKLQGRFKQWVQISSISTMCNGNHAIVNESHQGNARQTEYALSKLAADEWILKTEPKALIIHPTFMLGTWDAKPTAGALFYALKFNKIQCIENNYKNIVAASDVANGIFQAISHNLSGHFILGGQNVLISDFLKLIADEMNIKLKLSEKTISSDTPDFIKELCYSSKVSCDKAHTSFGYSFSTPLETVIKETMDYFEKFKILKRNRIG